MPSCRGGVEGVAVQKGRLALRSFDHLLAQAVAKGENRVVARPPREVAAQEGERLGGTGGFRKPSNLTNSA